MTRARKATTIGRATAPQPVGTEPLGSDALVMRFDALQQDRNERVQDDIHRGELVWELGAAEVDPFAGAFRSVNYEPSLSIETIWSDEEEPGQPPSDEAFAELRNADVDGVEP